jgi:hypothetical protein
MLSITALLANINLLYYSGMGLMFQKLPIAAPMIPHTSAVMHMGKGLIVL